MSHMAVTGSYLCSRCGSIFEAPADSIDRTREANCYLCSDPDPFGDNWIQARLKGMTT